MRESQDRARENAWPAGISLTAPCPYGEMAAGDASCVKGNWGEAIPENAASSNFRFEIADASAAQGKGAAIDRKSVV